MFGYLYEFVFSDCTVLKYENNLSEILRMFQLAYEAIMQGYAQGNRGLVDYLSSFKDSVIECLTGVISSITFSEKNTFNSEDYAEIYKHFEILKKFIFESCQKKYEPNVEYMRDCVNLLLDYTNVFPEECNQNFQTTVQLLNSLKVEEFKQIIDTLQ